MWQPAPGGVPGNLAREHLLVAGFGAHSRRRGSRTRGRVWWEL